MSQVSVPKMISGGWERDANKFKKVSLFAQKLLKFMFRLVTEFLTYKVLVSAHLSLAVFV